MTLPLTSRYLGERADDMAAVVARHSAGTISDRAVRDLARYESEVARLRALPAPARRDEPLPPDDVRVVLSRSVGFLAWGADLPGMLEALREGKPAAPRPRRGWMLLVPQGGGEVEERVISREDEGWLLEWFHEPTTIGEVASAWDAREAIEELWAAGRLDRGP